MIYLLLTNGFEETEAVVPLDILRRLGVRVITVGVGGQYVTGSHNITIKTDISLDEVSEEFDMLILPGGMPGTDNLQKSEGVKRLSEKRMRTANILLRYVRHQKFWVKWVCLSKKTQYASQGMRNVLKEQ